VNLPLFSHTRLRNSKGTCIYLGIVVLSLLCLSFANAGEQEDRTRQNASASDSLTNVSDRKRLASSQDTLLLSREEPQGRFALPDSVLHPAPDRLLIPILRIKNPTGFMVYAGLALSGTDQIVPSGNFTPHPSWKTGTYTLGTDEAFARLSRMSPNSLLECGVDLVLRLKPIREGASLGNLRVTVGAPQFRD